MKKVFSLLVAGALVVLTAASCQQAKPMDAATIAAKADSVYKAKTTAVADSINKDCQTNMAAWVQSKADSITAAASTGKK